MNFDEYKNVAVNFLRIEDAAEFLDMVEKEVNLQGFECDKVTLFKSLLCDVQWDKFGSDLCYRVYRSQYSSRRVEMGWGSKGHYERNEYNIVIFEGSQHLECEPTMTLYDFLLLE